MGNKATGKKYTSKGERKSSMSTRQTDSSVKTINAQRHIGPVRTHGLLLITRIGKKLTSQKLKLDRMTFGASLKSVKSNDLL